MRFLEWLSASLPRETIHISSAVSAPLSATINISADDLPPGVSASRGVAALQQALLERWGAQWVTVRHSLLGLRNTVEVQSTGDPGPESEAIHAWLESFVVATLNGLAPDRSSPSIEAAAVPDAAAAAPADTQTPIDEATAATDSAVAAIPEPTAPKEDLRALSDADLLGRLLSHVSMLGGVGLATEAMQHYGSLAALLTAPERELMGLPGFDNRLAAAVKLTYAAALRLSNPTRPFLDGTMDRIAYLSQSPELEDVNSFRILYLNASAQLLADEPQQSEPQIAAASFPRKVVMRALELKAKSIVLVYTLLGGLLSPPEPQMRATAMIRDAAEALGLSVTVHITIENGRWPRVPDNRYRQALP